MNLHSLRSELVGSLPPVAFPEAPAPVRYEFDQGMVAEETLPLEELKTAFGNVLDRDRGEALQYLSYRDGSAYRSRYEEMLLGYAGLREQLAHWIGTRQGIAGLGADNFFLMSGASALFPLIAQAFVNPGEGVLMEAMTLNQGAKAFRMHGANVRAVDMDEDGLIPGSVEQQLDAMKREGVRPKLLYTIPTFQLPTGAVLPEQRRRALLSIAREWDLILVEDSVYAELRYSGTPVPSLLSMDRSGRVMQIHGFAKIVAPGIRLGWVCAHREMIDAIAATRVDFGVSQLTCRAMADFMARGRLDPHIERANALYRRKRDMASAAVNRHCGEWVTFTPPDGGMYLWLRMNEIVDWSRALQNAALAGVHIRPGQVFREDGARYLRLAFCHAPIDELEAGIAALGEAIKGALP